jgi:hypothetical protein
MVRSLYKNRLPFLVAGVALMIVSAICGLLYLDVVGKVSGWIGLPEYERYVPRLQWYGGLWLTLALTLPFLAALLLGLGKGARPRIADTAGPGVMSYPDVSHESESTAISAVLAYLLRLTLSVLVTVGFMIVIYFVASLLDKLGLRAH